MSVSAWRHRACQNITTINWNGGQPSDQPLEVLFKRFSENTLDPMFEDYGNFMKSRPESGEGVYLFHGNFFDYSHTFSVETNDPALIERFVQAIRANKATIAYKEAKQERLQEKDEQQRRRR
jgi:hypothetical protein